ncbi:MAG TPA: YciI family protein [Stackebrandtia sp.]|uniref:YciI family protein n=1 Tax=Stackebrandtia sp. TaxID=2023065 RepID=UPI002D5E0FB8|nr:YciI family protein [Stackebrandtia sp.]HZE41858.1 YciI family protein [Stackebrandtia sp.]
MKYLMLVCVSTEPVDSDGGGMDIDEWVSEMDGRGARVMGDRISPDADATQVRVRGGELLVTDGPYIETKDLMAGIDILECADLDEAIEVAAKHPMARGGVIEVRPFWTE